MRPYTAHHMGLTVSDLDRSTAFYTSFGGSVTAEGHFCGDHIAHALGLPTVDVEIRMVDFGSFVLELVHYLAPASERGPGRNSDVGSAHLAFEVSDIHARYDELVADGVEFNAPPQRHESGDFAGGYFTYLRDPDGNAVELLQPPPVA